MYLILETFKVPICNVYEHDWNLMTIGCEHMAPNLVPLSTKTKTFQEYSWIWTNVEFVMKRATNICAYNPCFLRIDFTQWWIYGEKSYWITWILINKQKFWISTLMSTLIWVLNFIKCWDRVTQRSVNRSTFRKFFEQVENILTAAVFDRKVINGTYAGHPRFLIGRSV